MRSAKTKLAKAHVDADQVELPATSSASIEEESIARQTAQVVTRVLASLTPRWRKWTLPVRQRYRRQETDWLMKRRPARPTERRRACLTPRNSSRSKNVP